MLSLPAQLVSPSWHELCHAIVEKLTGLNRWTWGEKSGWGCQGRRLGGLEPQHPHHRALLSPTEVADSHQHEHAGPAALTSHAGRSRDQERRDPRRDPVDFTNLLGRRLRVSYRVSNLQGLTVSNCMLSEREGDCYISQKVVAIDLSELALSPLVMHLRNAASQLSRRLRPFVLSN